MILDAAVHKLLLADGDYRQYASSGNLPINFESVEVLVNDSITSLEKLYSNQYTETLEVLASLECKKQALAKAKAKVNGVEPDDFI